MKKLSGIYVDNQGFRHTVYYERSKGLYCKFIHNPEGKYCSSMCGTKEQIQNQVEGMKRVIR